jgi:uncharacterized glyoxalase superfamily protein PhnB
MGTTTVRKLVATTAAAAAVCLGLAGTSAAAPRTAAAPPSDVGTQDTFREVQVSVYSTDVARQIAFYQVLGFTEQYRIPPGDPHPLFATIVKTGFFISLVDYGAMRQESGQWRIRPAYLQDSDVAVLVPDVDATVAAVRAAGYRVVMAPKEAQWGERFAIVEDPSGHFVQVSTHRTGFPGN